MSPCASARTLGDGIQISEALTGDGVTIFRHGVADEVDYRADAWDPLKVCARIYSYSSPEH